MKTAKWVPWIVLALALAATAAALLPQGKVRGFDLEGLAGLPLLEGGRVKPLDSLARNSLLVIRSQQAFRYQGRAMSADEWFLDVLFRPATADEQPAFVGYDFDHAPARILRYRKTTAKGKTEYQLVLDQTTFYAESGGQIGDTGFLEGDFTVWRMRNDVNRSIELEKLD